MQKTRYQNFDLEFYETGGRYYAKARSFNGEAKQTFVLPFSLDEVKVIIRTIEETIGNHQPNLAKAKEFGGSLFEAVFQNEVRALYKSSLDLALAQDLQGLRLRLHLQDMPALALLPWEYLYDAAVNQFLCFNRQTPVVRYLELPKAIKPRSIKQPLRILVMVSSPTAMLKLNVDEEKAKVKKALSTLEKRGLVQIHWLEEATVAELQKTLRRHEFHVFHFIGHGDFDAETPHGWLAFEDATTELDKVSAEQVGALLNNHPSLRLVVLNSCKGAQTASANPFAGTATTLVQLGIPAVVAMQFAITDEAAIQFAETFYSAIADRLPVDVATPEARVALFTGDYHPEWGTPVLFMRASDGSLFVNAEKESPVRPLTPSKPNARTALLYALITLLFAAVTFVILAIVPKSTVIGLEVYAKNVGFVVSAENSDESVSLLYFGLWTNALSIEKFQPIKWNIDGLATRADQPFANPLIIIPDPLNGRMTFLSPSAGISLQNVMCSTAGQVSLQKIGGKLSLAILQRQEAPSLKLSFDGALRLVVQECRIVDGAGHDLSQLFNNDTVSVELNDIARSLRVVGQSGELQMSISRGDSANTEQAQFLTEQQRVERLDFTKTIFPNTNVMSESTIDSLLVSRNFPLDSVRFKSRDTGDLELMAQPNQFVIYDLSERMNGLKIQIQARLQSLAVGRGALKREMVPGYLSFITHNPTTSLFITWLGWVVTVLIPLILKFKSRNKSEGDDE